MAQAWPTRPIKVIVAFPAGGIVDVVARVVAISSRPSSVSRSSGSSPASAGTSPDIVSRVIAT